MRMGAKAGGWLRDAPLASRGVKPALDGQCHGQAVLRRVAKEFPHPRLSCKLHLRIALRTVCQGFDQRRPRPHRSD